MKDKIPVATIVIYITALVSALFVAFNLYMFQIRGHKLAWLILTLMWAWDGVKVLLVDEEEINNLFK